MTSGGIQRESMKVVGYADRLSVQPGQKIRFMVSCAEPAYQADIVRLIHGDENPRGPGFKEELVQTDVGGRRPGRVQPFRKGSHVVVKNSHVMRRMTSITLQAWVYPTTPTKGVQGIITQWAGADAPGYGLFVDERGRLALWLRKGKGAVSRLDSGKPLRAFNWYFVTATYDGKTGKASLRQRVVAPCDRSESDSFVEESLEPAAFGAPASDLLIAACGGDEGQASRHFNGKIDGPKVYSRALTKGDLSALQREDGGRRPTRGLVAAWDFARETQSTKVADLSPNRLHGRLFNFPTRAVTGHNWSGHDYDFRRVPEEYNAIHFHDDDLGDAGWRVDFELSVPGNLKSGVYAARLRTGSSEDYVPFFVRPKRGKATARICFLVPTLSYLAYANEHVMVDPAVRRATGVRDVGYPKQRQDVYVVEHNLLGLYDHHTDGSGVCYTSRLRPILNMRPKYVMQSISGGDGSPHQFNADLHLVDWLEAKGYDYDVITDEDLHSEGLRLLSPYRVVLTGSHPEYWTERMLDSMQAYLNRGGRLMYLGGNGFYWVTTVNPEHPYIFEVRRWGGTGSWMANPGEYHNSFTGELGGVWRNRGRHPQKMVGVGFTAQGFDVNMPYKRQPDSYDARAAFIFEGIGKDEMIGDFPSLVQNSGAAGFELDRMDLSLGTPTHSLLLGTASGFSDSYQHVIEESTLMDNKQGGTTHALVKADLVYTKYPNGGGVFSVGSITWCGSLSYNGYDNNVSKMMSNVLGRFSAEGGLP